MTHPTMTPQEARRRVEAKGWRPRNVVWEVTLACNLRCKHCGSIAGKPRVEELTTDECLTVVDDLADLGAELITLSGGEPTLRSDWDTIARRIAERGVYVNMVTNGVYHGVTAEEIAARAMAAGMANVGISIDGDREVHDYIRGKGTFDKTMASIRAFTKAGMRVGVMTTVNKLNYLGLSDIREAAMASGATMWRLQLGKTMGSMKDNDDLAIDPERYYRLVPQLAKWKKKGGIHLAVGDSIGYYGAPDRTLRGWGWRGRAECWQGCQAGMQALGIEADGSVKGCLSLQAKIDGHDPFIEGNVREERLDAIWHKPGIFAFNRDFEPESLTGFCATCKHASLCRGGAKCVSSSFLGHVNEDPYCYYRLHSEDPARFGRQVAKGAAAAAAAVILAVGTVGCETSQNELDTSYTPADTQVTDVADTVTPGDDACCEPEYGVFVDMVDPEPDVQLEYGIPYDTVYPDVQVEYGIDIYQPGDAIDCSTVCCECDYGILPEDVYQACCVPQDVSEPDVQMDYGLPVDTAQPDVQMDYGLPVDTTQPDVQMDYGLPVDAVQPTDTVDCETVCCDCEYGVIPDEVWDKCCTPDPCADVCCDCDYGEPPPPECCE